MDNEKGRHLIDAALSAVREGGVEPPRPCGHWNLNPARLPIPPPAHWVCPRAPFLAVRRLPTPRTLARWTGWIHIPSAGAAAHLHRNRRHRIAKPSRTSQRVSVHVSTSYRSSPSPQEPVRVHSQVRDTGLRPPLRSLTGAPAEKRSKDGSTGNFDRRRHPSTGPTGGTSRFTGAWIRSVSSTR